MIITRTPFRISFFGGGTDYPAYFVRKGGATLVTSIDKYCTITVQPLARFFDHTIQIHYSKVESVNAVDQIEIPVVREVLRFLNIESGVEIHLASDLPARTGLATSSATTVGLLTALHAYRGEMPDNLQIAEEAVHVEQQLIKENIGCQDQYACAIGGLMKLEFLRGGGVKARPIVISAERSAQLRSNLMLFYTGIRRTAHDVVGEQIDNTSRGVVDEQLDRMLAQVRQGLDILCSTVPLREFGDLLHEAWTIKRSLSGRVSSPQLDEIYRLARAAGARGGKLLGAGAGGFFLLYVEPENQSAVRSALSNLLEVNFEFESEGSHTVFYRPSGRRGVVTAAAKA